MTRRIRVYLGTTAAILTICGFLIGFMAKFPARYSVSDVYCESDLIEIQRLTTSSGSRLVDDCELDGIAEWKQGLFTRSSILSAAGEILDASVQHLWIVLRDCYGRAYLQYPPATITGSRWNISNLRLGREIASIEFWSVDDEGHRSMQRLADRMIETGHWPAQREEDLPDRLLLGEVSLIFKRGFPCIF